MAAVTFPEAFRCQCRRWATHPCQAQATQEDMRCDNCRGRRQTTLGPEGCSLIGGPASGDGRTVQYHQAMRMDWWCHVGIDHETFQFRIGSPAE